MLNGRDDDRFEEVLGRLDALVRRGQPVEDRPPPRIVPDPAIPVLTEVLLTGKSAEEDTIPLLTEELSQDRDRVEKSVLQMLVNLVENTIVEQIQPALQEALVNKVAELRPQIEMLLRQRLQQTLTQKTDQTEE